MLNSLRCPNCFESLQLNFDQKKLTEKQQNTLKSVNL